MGNRCRAPKCATASRLPSQYQVYDPTPANVRACRVAAGGEDVVVIAARVLDRVRENRHPVERTVLVDAFCERDDGGREPSGIERHGAEGVADAFAQKERYPRSILGSAGGRHLERLGRVGRECRPPRPGGSYRALPVGTPQPHRRLPDRLLTARPVRSIAEPRRPEDWLSEAPRK